MNTKRKPYQAPELITLGLSVKDNSNPTEKAHETFEASVRANGIWSLYGPQGKSSHVFRHTYVTHPS
jgi:hypothetical protein